MKNKISNGFIMDDVGCLSRELFLYRSRECHGFKNRKMKEGEYYGSN